MCGIIGIVSERHDVAHDIYAGLLTHQHRGQESAGIVTWDDIEYSEKRGMGTVEVVFGEDTLSELPGRSGIGHVRYSTTGESVSKNIQPIPGEFSGTKFWIAHNGNLTNYRDMRQKLQARGYRFTTETDTELIAALIHFSEATDFESAVIDALARITGTYALAIISEGVVYGACDPTLNRPLMIAEGKRTMLLASESVAADVLGLRVVREVGAGELVVLNPETQNWYRGHLSLGEERFCIFEFVYFLRPDSVFRGRRVQFVREEMGRQLWREAPVEADVVVSVPDSGNAAAKGLSQESGLPFERDALFRPHSFGRSFILPLQKQRERYLNLKHNVIWEFVRDKRVVLVDDSIVRASTIRSVIGKLRNAGAREIHIRISSPPYIAPCYYGIDTYRVKDELIARRLGGDIEHIRREIGAESLHYLSLDGMKRAVAGSSTLGFCDACFSGKYHIPIEA